MPRPGPSGIQQQVYVGRGEPPGGHLLNFHHGTPPLQHDSHHPSTGKPQHFCKVNILIDASLGPRESISQYKSAMLWVKPMWVLTAAFELRPASESL